MEGPIVGRHDPVYHLIDSGTGRPARLLCMPPSILLADDNWSVRKAMRTYLELTGFEICGEAADGLDAVAKATALKPDFVVLDLAMPGMNGFDAARKLHEIVPDAHLVVFTLYK